MQVQVDGWPDLSSQELIVVCPTLLVRFWREGGHILPNLYSQRHSHPLSPPPCPFRFDLDGPFDSRCVMEEAAPSPVLRFLHQSPLDRIAMHVAQLLNPLLCRPNIEIVIPALPKGKSTGALRSFCATICFSICGCPTLVARWWRQGGTAYPLGDYTPITPTSSFTESPLFWCHRSSSCMNSSTVRPAS